MTLPDPILHAISQPEGGRVVLVVGAGCSAEPPTCLPLSRECAIEAHRRLVTDGVLGDSDCPDPCDLSCVSDAVMAKTGSQQAIVARLPREQFIQAEPNEGHLLAAALLYERAIGCVMTLNFDLAMSSALVQIGAKGKVAIIEKPEDHNNLGPSNLVYLHRNAHANPDDWVLRSKTVEQGWKDGWEQVIAQRVVSSPVTVFAGLGTPAAVLIDTTTRIRIALQQTVAVYQVDPEEKENSLFFESLNLPDTSYLKMTWCEFMRRLAKRFVEEDRVELGNACRQLAATEGWDWSKQRVTVLCNRMAEQGLIRLGRIRARWLLDDSSYLPRHSIVISWLADMLFAIGLIEEATGSEGNFCEDGVVEFRRGNLILGGVIIGHGRGFMRWAALEAKFSASQRFRQHRAPQPQYAIVGGVPSGPPADVAPPQNIVCDGKPDSLITTNIGFKMYTVEQIIDTPQLIREILS